MNNTSKRLANDTIHERASENSSKISKSGIVRISSSSDSYCKSSYISSLTLSAYRRSEESVRLTDCPIDCHIHHTYHINRVLGHGASSTVRLAIRRSDGKRFAVKCIPKHIILREKNLLNEISILKDLNHPNIVTLIDVFETENEIQIVMEYCPGGELFDVVLSRKISSKNLLFGTGADDIKKKRGLPEKDAAKIISSLLQALSYLHCIGIVHCDIKPENVLLVHSENGEMDVKLSDFGSAQVLNTQDLVSVDSTSLETGTSHSTIGYEIQQNRSRVYSSVVSDYYTAPEVYLGEVYDTSADLYSLGVIMYIVLFNDFPSMPLDISSRSDVCWNEISSEAKDLLQSLLDQDPSRRITAEAALRHDWITQNIMVAHKRNLVSFSVDEGRICKKAKFMDIVDVDTLSSYDDNDIDVIVEDRGDDKSSRAFPPRQICLPAITKLQESSAFVKYVLCNNRLVF